MSPRFKVGDVAWFCPDLEDKFDRGYFLVVLKLQVNVSSWRVTYLYAWTQGSGHTHSVRENHLFEIFWTFTGYLRRENDREGLCDRALE